MNNTATTASNKLATNPMGVIGASVAAGFLLGKIITFPSIWVILAIVALAVYMKRR